MKSQLSNNFINPTDLKALANHLPKGTFFFGCSSVFAFGGFVLVAGFFPLQVHFFWQKRTDPSPECSDPQQKRTNPRRECSDPWQKRTDPRRECSDPLQKWTDPRCEFIALHQKWNNSCRECIALLQKRTDPSSECSDSQ
jgi:hypothetical protein